MYCTIILISGMAVPMDGIMAQKHLAAKEQ